MMKAEDETHPLPFYERKKQMNYQVKKTVIHTKIVYNLQSNTEKRKNTIQNNQKMV